MSYLTIPDITKPVDGYPPADPVITYKFPLDNLQQQAVLAIHREENVFTCAPTGTGKTLVGEYQIAYSLKQGKRVFYTTPIKSLSNQKYYDLKHLFPHASVGIMTGDIKSNPEADIVIMTTEILRNLLFKQNTSTASLGVAGAISLENVGAVVFDECHYINEPERGHVWEETLILLPPAIKLILLSATIDSPELFGAWIGAAKQRPIVLLKTSHRIVPLIHGVFDPTQKALPLIPLKAGDEAPYDGTVYRDWLKSRDAHAKAADDWKTRVGNATASGSSIAGANGKVKIHNFTHTLNTCVSELLKRDLCPALFFVFSRKECERYASQVTGSLIDSSDTASVKHIISFHLHKYDDVLKHLPQYHQIVGLLERGIAFHHSGLLPLLKEIVELLFSRGFIKALFCTETFAVGLNMPARTVVFLDLKKPQDGGGFRPLRSDEYIQMAGRAGRRGKDARGIVMYMPSRNPVEPDEMRSVLSGRLHPLTSRLQFHYDFITKALHSSQAPDATALWSAVIQNSYWNSQQVKATNTLKAEKAVLVAELEALPLTQEHIVGFTEYEKLQGTIKSSTNAAKRKAQAALDQWKERHATSAWKTAASAWANRNRIQAKLDDLNDTLDRFNTDVESVRVAPIMCALAEWEAVVPSPGIPKLTTFGTLVTEINEGNPLLIAQLYQSKLLQSASEVEIVSVLGAFIVDRESEEKTVHPYDLPHVISDTVKEVLITVDTWGNKGVAIDRKFRITSPESYWGLTTLWVEIATDWLTGATAAELAAKYEIYEGNLMRGLHKLASLVNEWIALATFKSDVDMLEKLKGTPQKVYRDIAQPESLYLRL
jgi:superfamily II RNA helicase